MRRVLLIAVALAALSTALPAAGSGTARKPSHPRIHVVYRGQTLAMIAKRYHVAIDALERANDLHGARLKPKQKLIIPDPDDKDGSRARRLHDAGALDPHTRPAAQTSHDDDASTFAKRPRHPGFVILHSTVGSWSGYAVRKGKVTRDAERNISRVLASWRSREKHEIDERLIRMIAEVSDHFGGRPIRVVSGFRPWRPTQYTPHSQHNLGHAMDFSIPGVPNSVLRDFCRTLPNAGCGYYPNSSFVHMDARETSTYWIDFAGPGEAPRYATAAGTDPAAAQHDASSRRETGRDEADHEAAEREHEPEPSAPGPKPGGESAKTHAGTPGKSGDS